MILALGMILDALLGEPRWLWSRVPHPAVVMGRAVASLDNAFNAGRNRKLRGALVMLALGAAAIALGLVLTAFPFQIAEIICVAILLAQRSLAQHASAVGNALRLSLADGRKSVAMIVGRDTAEMDAASISRSAIESAAENLSDGVIAPAFWFLVGGLPGLFVYKITNTADSMIGYKTEAYREFGWAAARFDDLLNLIPARLTALLIWLTAPRPDLPAKIRAEAPQHRSPNAGWPEAAAAHHLDVALSGPRTYGGRVIDYPFVNAAGQKNLGPKDVDRMVSLLWKTWGIALIAVLAIALF